MNNIHNKYYLLIGSFSFVILIILISKTIDIPTLKRVLIKYGSSPFSLSEEDIMTTSVFNREQLLTSFGGDESFLLEIIDEFSKQLPGHYKMLNESFEDSDFPRLEMAAHTLKGLAAKFSAEEHRELASKVEQLAKQKSTEGVKDLISQIEVEFSLLNDELYKEFDIKQSA
jgi:HPt (histidine-containing phosphotransfer) domain-containing protein